MRDDPQEIGWAMDVSVDYDLVITTGGLGPTFDDITISSIAEHFGLKLVRNGEALKLIENWYRKIGVVLTEERLKMAMMPEGARVIRNSRGAAPAMMLSWNKCTIISVPGVPVEAISIMEDLLEDLRVPGSHNGERVYRVEGAMESRIAPSLKTAMERISGRVYIKSHPEGSESGVPGIVLQVTSSGDSKDEVEGLLDMTEKVLEELLSPLKLSHHSGRDIKS